MNPQQTQAPSPKDFNNSRINLGFITQMHEQLLQHKEGKGNNVPQGQSQQPQTPPVASQEAPGQEKAPETSKAPKEDVGAKITEMELNLTKKLDDMRKEMKDDTQREIDGIKQDIKSVLNEDEQETKA